jgi:hypothetical protein
MVAKKFFDDLGGWVATAKPDDFGGLPMQGGHDGKIGVLSHYGEGVGFGVLPKGAVIGLGQAKQANLA